MTTATLARPKNYTPTWMASAPKKKSSKLKNYVVTKEAKQPTKQGW